MASNEKTPESGLSNRKIGKRIYLATYAQADEQRFPTRKSFGEYVVEKFNSGSSKVGVLHWVVCKEAHAEQGFHYHCAFKMSGIKKWYGPWRAMYQDGIKVSFSDTHNYYVSAYKYVTKEDPYYYESPGHPNLKEIGSPRTKACIVSNKRRSAAKDVAEEGSSKMCKEAKTDVKKQWNKKLGDIYVGDFVIKKNICTKTQK